MSNSFGRCPLSDVTMENIQTFSGYKFTQTGSFKAAIFKHLLFVSKVSGLGFKISQCSEFYF